MRNWLYFMIAINGFSGLVANNAMKETVAASTGAQGVLSTMASDPYYLWYGIQSTGDIGSGILQQSMNMGNNLIQNHYSGIVGSFDAVNPSMLNHLESLGVPTSGIGDLSRMVPSPSSMFDFGKEVGKNIREGDFKALGKQFLDLGKKPEKIIEDAVNGAIGWYPTAKSDIDDIGKRSGDLQAEVSNKQVALNQFQSCIKGLEHLGEKIRSFLLEAQQDLQGVEQQKQQAVNVKDGLVNLLVKKRGDTLETTGDVVTFVNGISKLDGKRKKLEADFISICDDLNKLHRSVDSLSINPLKDAMVICDNVGHICLDVTDLYNHLGPLGPIIIEKNIFDALKNVGNQLISLSTDMKNMTQAKTVDKDAQFNNFIRKTVYDPSKIELLSKMLKADQALFDAIFDALLKDVTQMQKDMDGLQKGISNFKDDFTDNLKDKLESSGYVLALALPISAYLVQQALKDTVKSNIRDPLKHALQDVSRIIGKVADLVYLGTNEIIMVSYVYNLSPGQEEEVKQLIINKNERKNRALMKLQGTGEDQPTTPSQKDEERSLRLKIFDMLTQSENQSDELKPVSLITAEQVQDMRAIDKDIKGLSFAVQNLGSALGSGRILIV